MTPAEIKKWQDEHGGPGGAPTTDANGITTYYAASGDYIAVRPNGTLAQRGFLPHLASQAQAASSDQAPAPDAAPAAAVAAAPVSGSMTQTQLEALLKQIAPNGEVNRLEPYSGTRPQTVHRPGTIMEPNATSETAQVPYVGWIDRRTGHTLEADVAPGGGSYTVTYNGVKEANQGSAATTAASDAPTVNQQHETRNGKDYLVRVTSPKPEAGQPLAPPTIEVFDSTGKLVPGGLPPEAGKPNTLQIAGKDGKTYIVPIDAQGKPGTPAAIDIPGPQATSATATEPLKGQPGWQVGKRSSKDAQGNEVSETYYIDPQGKETKTPPAEVNPETRVAITGEDGKSYTKVTKENKQTGLTDTYYENEQGQRVALPGKSSLPKGVPSFTPDLTKPGAGIIDRAKELQALVDAGTITPEQRQLVLAQDHTLTQSVANEFNVGAAVLREDYQNQTSQRNSDVSTANTRLTISNQHMENALGFVSKFMPYLGTKEGAAGNLFTGLLAVQVAHATALGGLKDVPREHMDPSLMTWAQRAVGGGAGAPAPVGGGTPPNAIGAGAVPDSIAPAAPAPASSLFTPSTGPTGVAPVGPSSAPTQYFPTGANGPQGSVNPNLERILGMQAPQSQREDAALRSLLASNSQQDVGLGQSLIGAPDPYGGQGQGVDMNAQFGPISPVLGSAVPGLTPELEAEARRQMDMALSGGRIAA